MSNKQTSLEWLQSKLPSLFEHDDNEFYKNIFEQAKVMHKEEIIDAATWGALHETGEQYYNDNYGKK